MRPLWNWSMCPKLRVNSNSRVNPWKDRGGRNERGKRSPRPDRDSLTRKERAVLHSMQTLAFCESSPPAVHWAVTR